MEFKVGQIFHSRSRGKRKIRYINSDGNPISIGIDQEKYDLIHNQELKCFGFDSYDLITKIEDPMTPIEQKIADLEKSQAEGAKSLAELKKEYAESLKPAPLKHWDVVENPDGKLRLCIDVCGNIHIFEMNGYYQGVQKLDPNKTYYRKSSKPFTVQQ